MSDLCHDITTYYIYIYHISIYRGHVITFYTVGIALPQHWKEATVLCQECVRVQLE